MPMIDLHTHTLLSDGDLVPAEHIRRAETTGYRVLGMCDHADLATMEVIIPQLCLAARRENELKRLLVLAGVELTHVRPVHMAEAAAKARTLGAQYVVVHGQTITEPVEEGTNRAGIEAGATILAHPGLISLDDARAAAQRGTLLEISGKQGHCLCNGYVAAMAARTGAKLIFGSDGHDSDQFYTRAQATRVCLGAGMEAGEVEAMFARAEQLARELAEL